MLFRSSISNLVLSGIHGCSGVSFFVISILIKLNSKGPIIHFSKRIGLNNKIFRMPKFRTMLLSVPQIETSKLKKPGKYITKIGRFLRYYSLDELPQIYNILVGQMSFVGPRPLLFNQYKLKYKRKILGIHKLKPGLTGLAQINGRDKIGRAHV